MSGPKTLNNVVDPLTWNVPIADKDGRPTQEFQRKWIQQARTNGEIPDLTTPAAVSSVLDVISSAPGSLLERGSSQWGGLPSPSDAALFLNGAAFPAFAAVKDSDLSISDITNNNVSTAKHGFVPKAPNDATVFLDGTGGYSTPAGNGTPYSVFYVDTGGQAYVAVVVSDSDPLTVLDPDGVPVYIPYP